MWHEHNGQKSRDCLEWFPVRNVPDVFKSSRTDAHGPVSATTSIIEWYFVYEKEHGKPVDGLEVVNKRLAAHFRAHAATGVADDRQGHRRLQERREGVSPDRTQVDPVRQAVGRADGGAQGAEAAH